MEKVVTKPEQEEIILSDSPKAAAKATITYEDPNNPGKIITSYGWVSRHHTFFGDNEKIARYHGSTHNVCERCQKPTDKPYTKCPVCRAKAEEERYFRMEYQPWNGKAYVFDYNTGEYFYDLDSFLTHYEDSGEDIELARLVLTRPVFINEVSIDYFEDCFPEDHDPPAEFLQILEEFNMKIKTLPAQAVSPTNIRTKYIKGETERIWSQMEDSTETVKNRQ